MQPDLLNNAFSLSDLPVNEIIPLCKAQVLGFVKPEFFPVLQPALYLCIIYNKLNLHLFEGQRILLLPVAEILVSKGGEFVVLWRVWELWKGRLQAEI